MNKKPDKFGFIYKDFSIFKQYCKEPSIPTPEPMELPQMNNIHDYATWVVQQYKDTIGEEEFKKHAQQIFK